MTVFVCLAVAGIAMPALARGSAGDVVATDAYLRADLASVRAAYALTSTRIAAIDAREREVAAGCPSALMYAPRDFGFSELTEELDAAQWYAGLAPARSILLRTADRISHLSWSDRTLTRLVHAEAAEERADAELVLPGVCSQIEAWKESAYTTLPPGVRGFLAHVEAIEASSSIGPSEESREALIMRLLRRYERREEERLAKRIQAVEQKDSRLVSAAANAASKQLAAAMGVSEL